MRRQPAVQPPREPDALTLASGTWLAAGIVLLGLTPLPLHDAQWGWSPAFWLLLAPALLLLAGHLRTKQPMRANTACRAGRRCRSKRLL